MVIIVDKTKKKNEKLQKCENNIKENNKEQYGYDFIPHLHEWVNIDEQKETAKRLEDISKE